MPGCQVSQAGEESRDPREGPTAGPAPGRGASQPQEAAAASERDRVRRMWLEYRLRGEASQKEKLVGYYMEWFDWIVACNAFRVRCPVEKVRGPGMEALIEAVEEYDPSSCAPFEGFAAEKIKWAIRNAVCDVLRPLPRPAGARNPPPDPAKVVEFNELVQELLLACPEGRAREIARRRFLMEESVDEIASDLGVGKTTVDDILAEVVLPRLRSRAIELGLAPWAITREEETDAPSSRCREEGKQETRSGV